MVNFLLKYFTTKKSQFSLPTNIIKNCGSDRNKKKIKKIKKRETERNYARDWTDGLYPGSI